jgi:hypothetical protein
VKSNLPDFIHRIDQLKLILLECGLFAVLWSSYIDF